MVGDGKAGEAQRSAQNEGDNQHECESGGRGPESAGGWGHRVAALPAGLKNAHDVRGYPPALSVKQGWEPYPMKRGHRGRSDSCLTRSEGRTTGAHPQAERSVGSGDRLNILGASVGQPQPDWSPTRSVERRSAATANPCPCRHRPRFRAFLIGNTGQRACTAGGETTEGDDVELGIRDLVRGAWAADLVRNAARAEEAGFISRSSPTISIPWIDRQGQSPFVWSGARRNRARDAGARVGTG